MKKLFALLTATTLITASSIALAERPIKVYVGGYPLETDVRPITVEDRTMLPARAVFEAIGATVDYIDEEEKVVATKDDTVVEFVINSNIMKINGEEKSIDVPAMIKNDRTLIPVRACAEAFDLNVDWNDTTHTVNVRIPVSLPIQSENMHMEYDNNGNLILEEYLPGTDSGYSVDYTYNEHDLLIRSAYHDGSWWEEYTYDDFGNRIRSESSDGSWTVYQYDENDQEIFWEDSEGSWTKFAYNENGQLIYFETSDGFWEETLYDEYDRFISYRSSDDNWEKTTYDDNGDISLIEGADFRQEYSKTEDGNTLCKETNSDGSSSMSISKPTGETLYYEDLTNNYWAKYEYDENNNWTYYEDSKGYWFRYTYEDNLCTYYEHSDGTWEKYTYNDAGNITYFENSEGEWHSYNYDENQNIIYFEDSDGYWEKCDRDEDGNILYQEASSGYWEKYIVIER